MSQRTLGFDQSGWEDFLWWVDNDRKLLQKIRGLIDECLRDPLHGTGMPERLNYKSGLNIWSRRITQEDRLVYEVRDDAIIVLQARFHY